MPVLKTFIPIKDTIKSSVDKNHRPISQREHDSFVNIYDAPSSPRTSGKNTISTSSGKHMNSSNSPKQSRSTKEQEIEMLKQNMTNIVEKLHKQFNNQHIHKTVQPMVVVQRRISLCESYPCQITCIVLCVVFTAMFSVVLALIFTKTIIVPNATI